MLPVALNVPGVCARAQNTAPIRIVRASFFGTLVIGM